jgi:3-deoxy-7-phosphoheptulonate synthase
VEPQGSQNERKEAQNHQDHGQEVSGPEVRKVNRVNSAKVLAKDSSRNVQNFTLQEEVGKCRTPILLKRGMSTTLQEFLQAAEYVMKGGNHQIMLCERGIRTFETSTRNTLDLNAVPMLKRHTHRPVIGDPSHGTGHRWMVPWLARSRRCRSRWFADRGALQTEGGPERRAAITGSGKVR